MSNEKVAFYPGTFDPFTLGHLDIVIRTSKLFSKVVIALGINSQKKNLFDINERIAMIEDACKEIPNISIVSFQGLAVEAAEQSNASAIIRGVRNEIDYSYETQMAMVNTHLKNNCETVFLPTKKEFMHISSSFVKEIASWQGDVSKMVTKKTLEAILKKNEK